MEIEEIISSTRKIIDNHNRKFHSKELLKLVVEFYKATDIPELILCNSYDKHASTFYTNKWYIIYDIHLSEILLLANKIYYGSFNKLSCEKLIYRFYSEELLLLNKIRSANYCAERYSEMNYKFTFSEKSESTILNIIKIQELFILSHELSHWYYFGVLNSGKRKDLLSENLDLFNRYFNEVMEEGTIPDKDASIYDLIIDYLNCNDKLIEECICDINAVSYILSHYRILCAEYDFSSIEIAECTFLCINILQLLCFIKYDVTCIDDTNREYKDLELTIRQVMILKYLGDYYSKFEPNLYDKFTCERPKWQHSYKRKIYSIFREISDDVFSKHYEFSKNDISILDQEWIPMNKVIMEYLSS